MAYARTSPITYISRGDPPILIFYGDGDRLVPFNRTNRDAYLKAGLEAELVKVGNADHDFEPVPE